MTTWSFYNISFWTNYLGSIVALIYLCRESNHQFIRVKHDRPKLTWLVIKACVIILLQSDFKLSCYFDHCHRLRFNYIQNEFISVLIRHDYKTFLEKKSNSIHKFINKIKANFGRQISKGSNVALFIFSNWINSIQVSLSLPLFFSTMGKYSQPYVFLNFFSLPSLPCVS